jgi:hypothetical protein
MEFNNKRLEKTSRLINYFISFVLCVFLILLSGKLIDDVDDWKESPSIKAFENTQFLEKKKAEKQEIEKKVALKYEKINSLENTIKIANSNYENAKRSFDNWLETRKTVGSPKEDKEVLSRAAELDKFYKTEMEWIEELAFIQDSIALLNKQKEVVQTAINQEQDRAYEEQEKAIRKYELKVFLIRLLFILPIFILGIFFIVKYRKHKYWPLFFGYVLFSFYAFFFGLVPYMPSYGGYIRYVAGIIVSIGLGVYSINKIKAFIESKKEELSVSTAERAKKVQTETAEKALDNHMCPSCGKDFIMKKWDKPTSNSKIEVLGTVTNYCRFCGLQLFKGCISCGSANFAHLPFCSNCGDRIEV